MVLGRFVCVCSFVFAATFGSAQFVAMQDGIGHLHLNNHQQRAADAYLKQHPHLKITDCTPTSADDVVACRNWYQNWMTAVSGQNAIFNYPTASWGDFRNSGTVDFAMAFYVPKAPGTKGWERGEIVVFENLGGGQYRPVVAISEDWGRCLDGMVFHPVRKQLEIWCHTATATAKWNGSTFVSHVNVGD